MTKLKIKVLGSGREVGRAGIVVESNNTRILLDYGVSVSEDEPLFPLPYPPKMLDGIVLSHAHLDHSGALPLLYISQRKPLFATRLTMELTDILIKDFLKIAGYYVPYELEELYNMHECVIEVNYGEEQKLGNATLHFDNAGHIPGSMTTKLEIDGVRILYTGDINTTETALLKAANVDTDVDLVLMEATYAEFDHPDRKESEKALVDSIREVLEDGGVVLIPAFAVGRSQEIACVLEQYLPDVKIYLDGMSRIVFETLINHPDSLKDPKLVESTYRRVIKIRGWQDRLKAVKSPSVIISPAGMLKGGAAVFYLKKIYNNPKNAVFLVSYQARGTPGRELLEDGVFYQGEKPKKIKARVEWFDFSSHSGRKELIELVNKLPASAKVVILHSEEPVGMGFKEYCEKELGLETYFPQTGEELSLNF